MEIIYYWLPKAMSCVAIIGSLVLIWLVWRRTRVMGYAVLAAVLLLGQVSSFLVLPYVIKHSLVTSMALPMLYSTWAYMVFSVASVLAWWHIYKHTKRAGD